VSDTPFVETELLLAVMREEDDRAAELVEGMLPNERAALRGHLLIAASWVADVCEACGKVIRSQRDMVTVGFSFAGPRKVYHSEHAPGRSA